MLTSMEVCYIRGDCDYNEDGFMGVTVQEDYTKSEKELLKEATIRYKAILWYKTLIE